MKKTVITPFFMISFLLMSFESSPKTLVSSVLEENQAIVIKQKICQGHGYIIKWHGLERKIFERAKTRKAEWDEELPYDTKIKNFTTKVFKGEDHWGVELDYTHVDDCPDCDKYKFSEKQTITPPIAADSEKQKITSPIAADSEKQKITSPIASDKVFY